MKCPVDHSILVIAERSGIEIDHCPTCRGVWLDRGELDKIMDRAAAFDAPSPARSGRSGRDDDRDDDRQDNDRDRDRDRDDDRHDNRPHGDGNRPGKRKRASFLGDLFEFGG